MESELEMLQWLFSSHKDDLMISLACIDRAVMFMLSVQSTKKAARQHFFFPFIAIRIRAAQSILLGQQEGGTRNDRSIQHVLCIQ